MIKYKVRDRQTIFDIALLIYGSVAGVAMLLEDNELQVDQQLSAGQILFVRADQAIQETIAQALQKDIPTHGFSELANAQTDDTSEIDDDQNDDGNQIQI